MNKLDFVKRNRKAFSVQTSFLTDGLCKEYLIFQISQKLYSGFNEEERIFNVRFFNDIFKFITPSCLLSFFTFREKRRERRYETRRVFNDKSMEEDT